MNPQARPTTADVIALTTQVLAALGDLERGVVPEHVANLVAASPALRERLERAQARLGARAADAPGGISGGSLPNVRYELLGAHVTWRDAIASVRGEVANRADRGAAEDHLALHLTVRVTPTSAHAGPMDADAGPTDARVDTKDADAGTDPTWQVETLSLRPAAGAQRYPMQPHYSVRSFS